MLGFSPLATEPIGSALFVATEPGEVTPVSVAIGWTEAAEIHAVSVNVSALDSVSASLGWVEAAEIFSCSIVIDSPEYARAPDGPGFRPQRCGRQNRPPAFQGRCK